MEAAARNQAVLERIRVAAEGPELTVVYPATEDKEAGQPGNVEAGGTKTDPGVAGSTEVPLEAEQDLMEIGCRDAGSLDHWNAAEGRNPAEGLHEEQEGSAEHSSLLGSGHKLLGLADCNSSVKRERENMVKDRTKHLT